MVKIIGLNSVYLIGKVKDVKLQLAAIENKNITVAEYIKLQSLLYKNRLH